MQDWQKDRNYRKYKNPDGTFTYIITIEGEDILVSKEVFDVYSQEDRRERYCAERDTGKLLSLDKLDEDSVPLSCFTERFAESAEDAAVRAILHRQVLAIIEALPIDEQRLIRTVVIDGVTEQDYAEVIGVSQVAVHKRKKRLLRKILKIMGY